MALVQNPALLSPGLAAIFASVLRLTKQEQTVLCVVLSLLLVGWVVKAYRASHSLARSTGQLNSKYHASP